mgnify:CR=1 FL=1|jgi:hypothetical protein
MTKAACDVFEGLLEDGAPIMRRKGEQWQKIIRSFMLTSLCLRSYTSDG